MKEYRNEIIIGQMSEQVFNFVAMNRRFVIFFAFFLFLKLSSVSILIGISGAIIITAPRAAGGIITH